MQDVSNQGGGPKARRPRVTLMKTPYSWFKHSLIANTHPRKGAKGRPSPDGTTWKDFLLFLEGILKLERSNISARRCQTMNQKGKNKHWVNRERREEGAHPLTRSSTTVQTTSEEKCHPARMHCSCKYRAIDRVKPAEAEGRNAQISAEGPD